MGLWCTFRSVVCCSRWPDVCHDQTWLYLLWTFEHGFKERASYEIHDMAVPAYRHDLSRAGSGIFSLLVMIMPITNWPNQALEHRRGSPLTLGAEVSR